jgi:hypothetical protein|tara:strand:- start:69 stop:362 length:294 start_codon:yes stop_codon:yes gene_type:complete
MAIQLTEEEKILFNEGKLDPNNIEEYRKEHPIKVVDLNEVDQVKEDIRQANIEYKEAIQKNKDLYKEIEVSRKKKEECRNKISELRIKKKKLLGLIE